MGRRRLFGLVLLASIAAAVMPSTARAQSDTKKECLAASDRAQQLRIEGKLRGARESLAVCGRNECPALVRQDCVQWMSEVLASLPSVVVGARDAQGHDVVKVKVSIDGTVAEERLEGKPIPLDPGVHTFRYETAGAPAVEEQVVVREGEKNRPLNVTFAGPPGATTAGPSSAPAGPSSNGGSAGSETISVRHVSPSNTVVGLVVGGLGIVALGGALYFELSANSDAATLNDTCRPNCTASDVDSVRTKYVYAGVGLGVGLVAVGVATYFLLARPIGTTTIETRRSAAVRVDAQPTARGGTLGLAGEF
jgi:hypothetical protein